MLGNQRHEVVIFRELIKNIVGDKKYLFLEILDIRMTQQIRIGGLKYLICFVRNQMISNIIFVFEIKIESTLCNAGIVHDIGDGCFAEAIVDKERESRVQKGLTFSLFVVVNFSHRESPFLKNIRSCVIYLPIIIVKIHGNCQREND